MANKFQYQQRAAETVTARAEQTSRNFIGFLKDSVDTYSAKKENWLRIMPPTYEGAKHYGLDVWVHYSVGPQQASVICLLKQYNQKCPVCEVFNKLQAEGRDDEAYDFKATRRVLVWLVDRNDEQKQKPEDRGPIAWAMPWTLDRDISKVCIDKQTGELYLIDHPETGYDISFDREGELPNVKYVGVQVARRATPIDEKYLDYIIENPLPSLLLKRTYEEVAALMEGGTTEAPPEAPAQQQTTQTQPPPQFEARNQAPAPVQQQPPIQQHIAQLPTQICGTAVLFNGQQLMCGKPPGHIDQHDFTIVGQAPQPSTLPPQPPNLGVQPQQQVPVQQPVAQAPAPQASPSGGRAAGLRARLNS